MVLVMPMITPLLQDVCLVLDVAEPYCPDAYTVAIEDEGTPVLLMPARECSPGMLN
jgi:hypothetical protein